MVARGRRARNRREGRKTSKTAEADAVPSPPYITRQIPYYDFLDEGELTRIEDNADWLVREIGVDFRDSPNALKLWRAAGADVKDCRVRAEPALVRSLCKHAPSEFIQHARNPEKSVKIGGRHAVFAPIYGAPFVHCLDKGRRYGSLEEYHKLAKLTASLPSLHHSGLVTCEPCDIPVNKRHMDMLYAQMRFSDKPMLGAITARERAEDCIAMAEILFGKEFFDNNCVIMGNVNTNSPLHVDKVVTDAIEVYCGRGQGIIVAPFILGGAMGPVTTAAALSQALAEAMMCCAYSQLVRKGAPFVLGNFLSSMSLRSGAPTFGMPEPTMSNYAIGQLARRLNLPLRCGGSLTASKLPDAQAAYESADSLHSTALGGANFILHSAGWMESGLATSFEKLIMDADRLAATAVWLSGMATDDNALARSAYEEVPPGGHFLGSAHTMENYRTAYFDSAISNSESFEQWEAQGSQSAAERANTRWKKLLQEYQLPPMDSATDEALQDYLRRKKSSMEDAWY